MSPEEIAALQAELSAAKEQIVSLQAENADMKQKMDAAAIEGAAPAIEKVADQLGVAKLDSPAKTLDAVRAHLKLPGEARDALPAIGALAAAVKRQTFRTPGEPVKDAAPNTKDADPGF